MIASDAQKLEPGQIVDLYEIHAQELTGMNYRFHPYNTDEPILWRGQSFMGWPVQASGFEMTGNSLPTPKIKVGNVGGLISALCIAYDDLSGVMVTRHRTLAKYLDGMPDADPDEAFPIEQWYIEQKLGESAEMVEFELSSALDFSSVMLPRRQIVANSCLWKYRTAECGYTGPPVATNMDIITTDARRDDCSLRVSGCKLRWGANNPLPYGGFPASGMT